MNIEDCRIKMCVCVEGRICRIDRIDGAGSVCVVDEYGNHLLRRASDVEPIAPDACESCQKLNESIEYWQTACISARRDAAYWREELTKLQKDPLEDTAPISEVAKIYIQISPAVLAQIIAEREE
jgi:hypothetical protein